MFSKSSVEDWLLLIRLLFEGVCLSKQGPWFSDVNCAFRVSTFCGFLSSLESVWLPSNDIDFSRLTSCYTIN